MWSNVLVLVEVMVVVLDVVVVVIFLIVVVVASVGCARSGDRIDRAKFFCF